MQPQRCPEGNSHKQSDMRVVNKMMQYTVITELLLWNFSYLSVLFLTPRLSWFAVYEQ